MRKIVLFLSVCVLWGLFVFSFAENAVTTATQAVSAGERVSGEQLKPMTMQLPKPRHIGTPRHFVERPHFELRTPKQVLLAPEGSRNLALNREVTTSCREPLVIGDLKQITDGKKDSEDGSYAQVPPGLQWIQIDLGQESEVYGIVVWHYHWTQQVYKDVVVRTADDKDFTVNVQTHFNNDYDNSSGLGVGNDNEYIETNAGRIIPMKGVKTRYVRLYSNGNWMTEFNHYTEVEVWGRPVKDGQSVDPAVPEKLRPQPIVTPRAMFISDLKREREPGVGFLESEHPGKCGKEGLFHV
jgi:hypothetical protein